MIDIVLLLVASIRTSMLIFEDLCQNSLMSVALISAIEVHSPSMDSIELIFDVARSSWRSLPASGAWVVIPLGNGWSVDLHLGALTCDEVLSLITAWLYH